jgi:hypothetical protein
LNVFRISFNCRFGMILEQPSRSKHTTVETMVKVSVHAAEFLDVILVLF